jgi:hypothetical protein
LLSTQSRLLTGYGFIITEAGYLEFRRYPAIDSKIILRFVQAGYYNLLSAPEVRPVKVKLK